MSKRATKLFGRFFVTAGGFRVSFATERDPNNDYCVLDTTRPIDHLLSLLDRRSGENLVPLLTVWPAVTNSKIKADLLLLVVPDPDTPLAREKLLRALEAFAATYDGGR